MLPAFSDTDHLAQRIHATLASHFSVLEAEPVRNISLVRVIPRAYSTVFFFNVETEKRILRLVAKTTVHHPENRAATERENQALVEFSVLQRLHPKFHEVEGCSISRPVLVIPEIETIVIEFIEGKVLADELGSARYLASREGFSRLRDLFCLAGRWLRHFHDATAGATPGPKAIDGILERCDFRLRLIEEAHDERCPVNLRNQVMTRLQKQRKLLDGERILVAGRHGDFGPWNILCNAEGITVLDFFGYQVEPVPVDLLQMIMALDREKACVTANARRIEALKQCFIKGYGDPPAAQGPLVFICETLQRICTVQGSLSNRGGWFHKRIERGRCVRSNLEWLTDGRSGDTLWPWPATQSVAANACS